MQQIFRLLLTTVLGLVPFILTAQCPSPPANYGNIPYFTSFETGIDNVWLMVEQNSSEIDTFPQIGPTTWGTATPYTGSFMLGMHQPNGGNYAQNEAWLRLNLCGQDSVFCSFKWMEWNDETEVQDGVYLSDDGGSNFTKVLDLNGASYTDLTWQSFTLNIDSLCAVNSLTLTEEFVIKFQQYDNYYFNGGNDGHFYDDIDVYSLNLIDTNAALTGLVTPGDTVCGNTNDTLQFAVSNVGEDDLYNIPVYYTINAGPAFFAGTIPGPLSTGMADTLTITSLPYTAVGTYDIVAYVQATGDSVSSNDTSYATVQNFPTPSPANVMDDSVCFGQSLQFIGTSGMNEDVMWYNANGTNLLNTGDTFSPAASSPGTYTFIAYVEGAVCTSEPDTITGIIAEPYSADLSQSGMFGKCQGDSLTVSVLGAYNSFNWSTGDTTQSITTGNTGYFYAEVGFESGCVGRTDTLIVFSHPPTPQPMVTASPDTVGCDGDTITLTSSIGGNLEWNDVNNSTTQSIAVTSSGLFAVTLTDSNGCENTSASVSVTIHDAPDIMFLEDEFPNRWCRNKIYALDSMVTPAGGNWSGQSVSNAEFSSNQTGTHVIHYSVSNSNGCFAADSLEIVVKNCNVGIDELNQKGIVIYPNPARNKAFIVHDESLRDVSVNLIDAMGRELSMEVNKSDANTLSIQVDGLPSGIYTVIFHSQDNEYIQRLVIE